jgi:hypothetical protein
MGALGYRRRPLKPLRSSLSGHSGSRAGKFGKGPHTRDRVDKGRVFEALASGKKTRETPLQQPLHAIPARAHRCCSMADFWRRGGADSRSLAGMSDLGLSPRVCKSWHCEGDIRTPDYLRECLPSKAPEIVRVPGDAIERSERTRLHAASAGAGLDFGASKKVDTFREYRRARTFPQVIGCQRLSCVGSCAPLRAPRLLPNRSGYF